MFLPTTNAPMTLLSVQEWPYLQTLIRLALGLALGLLIGLERERRGKEAGLRTFGFVALLGALGGFLGENFALASLFFTALLTVFLNIQSLRANGGAELTTSAAMLVTCISGILCGQGHTLTPAAVMVITTALLAWKQPLSGFTMGLTENELRSAILLAVLAIVIYPALPIGAIGPWGLIEPRAAWVTVILIAAIGFVNYVLWKIYGERGIELTGFLGGLVNSGVTVNELANRVGKSGSQMIKVTCRGILLAIAAMTARNVVLIALLAPSVIATTLLSFLLMTLMAALFILLNKKQPALSNETETEPVRLTLPFSLKAALKFGLYFLLLQVAGGLAQRELGQFGFYLVSFFGGLVSSASAVAAAASLAAKGTLSANVAGVGAVIASLTSVLVNIPLIWRVHNPQLNKHLFVALYAIAAVGLIGAFVQGAFMPDIVKRLELIF